MCADECVSQHPLSQVTNESAYGCQVFFVADNVPGVQTPTQINGTAWTLNVTSGHGDQRRLVFWSVDAAGNVGPNTTLVYTVDLRPPSTWPSRSIIAAYEPLERDVRHFTKAVFNPARLERFGSWPWGWGHKSIGHALGTSLTV